MPSRFIEIDGIKHFLTESLTGRTGRRSSPKRLLPLTLMPTATRTFSGLVANWTYRPPK